MYRIVIDSPESGFSYLESNDFELSQEGKEQIKFTNASKLTYDFIKDNCFVCIVKAGENAFCIGDFPVLINGFTNVKYVYPISSKYAIVCFLKNQENTFVYDGTPKYIDKDTVSLINQKIIENAERFIVFNHSNERYILEEYSRIINKEN